MFSSHTFQFLLLASTHLYSPSLSSSLLSSSTLISSPLPSFPLLLSIPLPYTPRYFPFFFYFYFLLVLESTGSKSIQSWQEDGLPSSRSNIRSSSIKISRTWVRILDIHIFFIPFNLFLLHRIYNLDIFYRFIRS